jgi:hypothetical protein
VKTGVLLNSRSLTGQYQRAIDLNQQSLEIKRELGDRWAVGASLAESAQADIFLTTDDRLLRKVQANSSLLRVQVTNPLQWFIQISSSGEAPHDPD